MKQVTREEFWNTTRQLERWSPRKIRYSRYEILEQGEGYQIQGQSWRDAETGELYAQYKSRVELALHVSSEYWLAANLPI
jgi:hypothetical protein